MHASPPKTGALVAARLVRGEREAEHGEGEDDPEAAGDSAWGAALVAVGRPANRVHDRDDEDDQERERTRTGKPGGEGGDHNAAEEDATAPVLPDVEVPDACDEEAEQAGARRPLRRPGAAGRGRLRLGLRRLRACATDPVEPKPAVAAHARRVLHLLRAVGTALHARVAGLHVIRGCSGRRRSPRSSWCPDPRRGTRGSPRARRAPSS
jgi:hypothetical protein